MDLSVYKINGTNNHLDYDKLINSLKSKLETTCSQAELIILNRFPVAITAQASIDFIILLKIPDIHNNYYRIKGNDGWLYVKNQIIAVSVIDEFQNTEINYQGNTLEIQNQFFTYQEDASKIKWGLTNYLADKCGLERNFITIHPLIWLKNNNSNIADNDLYVGKQLTYDSIEEVISKNYYYKWSGYKEWQNNDILFEHHIKEIFEQASKDSAEGFITKKKIDRIQRKFGVKQDEANSIIGTKLVEVKGKAGTGKTSELLKWMLKNSLIGKKGVFLTYNHLLVYDIASQVNSLSNRLGDDVKKASTTTYTIHGYFYNVAKKLGVLLLMTEARIKELTSILDNRWVEIEAFFNRERKPSDTSLSWLKMRVQNNWQVNQGIKREAILFIQHIEKLRFLPNQQETSRLFKSFRDDKTERLANLESSNIFLKDYVEVLKRTRQATTDLDGFLKDLDVESKYNLLHITLDLNPKIIDKDRDGKIDFEKLKTRYKKSISGFRAGRIAYIDEAQDCHPLERDILFNLFGSNNCVIANGGKEQLIRYSELCNWHISQNRKVDYRIYPKPSKSYRMKPAIAALANHIAKWYDIDLNIEPLETEDHGHIYISNTNKLDEQVTALDELHKIGERQGCTSYESLLLLKPADSNSNSNIGNEAISATSSIKVNEYNNIVNDSANQRTDWPLVTKAKEKVPEVYFWNSTGNVDKRELPVPGSLSVRSIYYASCRGIEAWSVMCFGLDTFFENKANEDEADNYLLNDLFDQVTPEQSREKYAATWVLMAVTRCLENCYIQLLNPQSSIYLCIKDFYSNNKNYVSLKN
jgi:Ca2+-binding EF-hand superfamily protein